MISGNAISYGFGSVMLWWALVWQSPNWIQTGMSFIRVGNRKSRLFLVYNLFIIVF